MGFYVVKPGGVVASDTETTEDAAYSALLRDAGGQAWQTLMMVPAEDQRKMARGLEDKGWSIRYSAKLQLKGRMFDAD